MGTVAPRHPDGPQVAQDDRGDHGRPTGTIHHVGRPGGTLGLVPTHATRRPLTHAQVVALADSVRALLDDPDAGLTEPMRRRWEGALTALETVLGEPSSLVDLSDDFLAPVTGEIGR